VSLNIPLGPPCHTVTPSGLYMGKGNEWPHCVAESICKETALCAWRAFHGLNVPGFDHLHKKKPDGQIDTHGLHL
jgi:hypothetical protein